MDITNRKSYQCSIVKLQYMKRDNKEFVVAVHHARYINIYSVGVKRGMWYIYQLCII